MSWMQRRYHAVTCTNARYDPSCVIADLTRTGGQVCPRAAATIMSRPLTLMS